MKLLRNKLNKLSAKLNTANDFSLDIHDSNPHHDGVFFLLEQSRYTLMNFTFIWFLICFLTCKLSNSLLRQLVILIFTLKKV